MLIIQRLELVEIWFNQLCPKRFGIACLCGSDNNSNSALQLPQEDQLIYPLSFGENFSELQGIIYQFLEPNL